MKDSVPERIERKMSQRDGLPFMTLIPVRHYHARNRMQKRTGTCKET